MGVAAELIREFRPGLRSEEVRDAMKVACDQMGCDLPGDVIVSHGPPVARSGTSRATASSCAASRSWSTSGRATAARAAGRT